MSVLLEVCVDRADGLAAAIGGGADRVELCAALSVGGLTPSRGMMAIAAASGLPVYAMIRPHAGDFVFDGAAIDVMMADIDAARDCGLAGVVLGASLADGRLDVDLLSALAERAGGMGMTLHRAFDLVPDPLEALEQAVALGFERVLTSGLQASAVEGAGTIGQLVEQARGRISIMPGGGVTVENVTDLVRRTGVREVHGSCRGAESLRSDAAVRFGFALPADRATSSDVVREMKCRLALATTPEPGT